MGHVDEGTIHAWLDGALAEGEGGAVAEHVAGCADCAAAVAEARGLVAASSRILSALDEVPGGVLPSAPGGATPLERLRAARARPARRWWRSPWLAAASMAFLAVTALLARRQPGAVAAGGGVESVAVDAAPAPAAVPAPLAVEPPDASPPAPMVARRAASVPSAPSAPNAAASGVPSRAVGPDSAAVVARAASPAPAPPPPAPVSAEAAPRALALDANALTAAERARVRGDVAVQRLAVAPVEAQGAAKAAPAAPAPTGAVDGAGCYRMPAGLRRQPADSLTVLQLTAQPAAGAGRWVARAGDDARTGWWAMGPAEGELRVGLGGPGGDDGVRLVRAALVPVPCPR